MNDVNKRFYEIFEMIESEFDEINQIISAVEIMSDHKLYNHYLKRLKRIEKLSSEFKRYKKSEQDLEVLEQMVKQDNDLSIQTEINFLKESQRLLFDELKSIYAESGNGQDEKVVIEISSKDDVEFCKQIAGVIHNHSLEQGFGYECAEKESLVLKISGESVFENLKMLSGKIKKVERGIETFATVVVLKTEEQLVDIQEKDLIIQTSKSGGAGGQHINKTESAVKIIHVPTGIFAECQDERSQTKNKEKAMNALREKIIKNSQKKAQENIKNQRAELKGKIFANTPEIIFDFDTNKVIFTSSKLEYKLQDILKGNLGLIINNQIK